MNNPDVMLDYEEQGKSLRDYVNVLRRRKRAMGITAAVVFVVVVLTAFLWPPTYRSESIILIEQQDIPAELVQTTITSYAQQRIEEIKARIMTIGNIMGIVEEYKLYTTRELERKTRTEIATEFREAVSIRPISAEVVDPRSGRPTTAMIAFSLAFDGDTPAKVQRVTNELTTLYLDENLKERTEQTLSTSEFLSAEAEMLSNQLETMDGEIALFKEENKGALPELNQFNMSVVDRTDLQMNDLTFQIKEMEKRKFQLEGDLSQLSPNAPVVLATGEAVLSDADRLKALQTQLRQAEASYRADHPTVVSLRRELAAMLEVAGEGVVQDDLRKQLRIERDRLAGLISKYTAEHPEIIKTKKVIASIENELVENVSNEAGEKADNPAYVILKTQVRSIDEDIRVNSQKIGELSQKLERYEGYLSRAPQVEKEYLRLQRDYQNKYIKYQEIRSKQMSAELAKNLESEQKGERFTLIQPPELPIQPVSPNRVALVLLGLILAGGAGVGTALLLEALDDAVYGINDVTQLTGAAPLVAIGYIETKEEAQNHNRERVYIVAGLAVTFIVLVMLFHFFIKPIDVTWYILMRKFGIN